MKKIILIVVSALVLTVAAIVTSVIVEVRRSAEPESTETVRLTVEKGASFSAVVRQLNDAHLLRRPWAIKAYAKLTRVERRVHRGTYAFAASESPLEMLQKLIGGVTLQVKVTVPEGFMIWEIAGTFKPAGVDSSQLLAAFMDPGVRSEREIEAPSLEGYLFPDTYSVPFGVTPKEVVQMMLSRLDEVYTPSLIQRTAQIGMTPHEILTLASIIEAEARVGSERSIISAVYHNRIKKRMRLEADPTVADAMGGFKGRLLYADLEIKSPYNTYRNYGLPLGPICSPGEAAITAALNPDEGTTALYFVARADGSHIFSQTLKQHRANVREVRKKR